MNSIVIPCYWYNQELVELTKSCLESLEFNGEIIVVNDGSPISAHFDGVKQIDRPVNGGYAAAVNTGLKAAKGDIIIVSNNDTLFIQPDWLDHLLLPIKQGYDISTIRSTEPDGWNTEERIQENAKFGCIFAITKHALDTVGYFDESLGKGYHEDADLYYRALGRGLTIAKNHAGLVHHIGKQTYKTIDPDDKLFEVSSKNFIKKWGVIDAD